MIISTSSSVRPSGSLHALALACLLAGCGQAGDARSENLASPTAAAAAAPKPASTPAAPPATRAREGDLGALYTADFARALAGEKKVAFAASGNFGDMTCSPQKIAGRDLASRALTLTLPADPALRRHALAVVTPERGWLDLYAPYQDTADSEDIIIPSRVISWAKASTERRFATSTDHLDGLRPGSDTPEVLFLEPGRYRFALVNGNDLNLLKANRAGLKVLAACSFDWTP